MEAAIELDPTTKLCRPRDSFTTPRPTPTPPPFFTFGDEVPLLEPDIKAAPAREVINPPPVNVDARDFAEITALKTSYGRMVTTMSREAFDTAVRRSNPFETGRSIFMSRAGVKLANIDAVFGLSGHDRGFLVLRSPGITPSEDVGGPAEAESYPLWRSIIAPGVGLNFVDLAGAPGAFSEYLLWRITEAQGVGISLRTSNVNFAWQTSRLDNTRFNVSWGADGTGSLYTNAESFAQEARDTLPEGIDLAVADGGLDVRGQEERQEFLNIRLILSETIVALQVLRPGGSFVCKIYDTFTRPMGELLCIVATAFRRFTIFKPMTSRPSNSERYVIGQDFRGSDHPAVARGLAILRAGAKEYRGAPGTEGSDYDTNVVQFLKTEVPRDFLDYLGERTRESIRGQLVAGRYILETVIARESGGEVTLPSYNIYNALAYWNIPDNA